MRSGPARSAHRRRAAAARRAAGSPRSTIPGAPWHHCSRIEPSRDGELADGRRAASSRARPRRPPCARGRRRSPVRAARARVVEQGRRERSHVADEPVDRAEVAELVAVESLAPETVLVPARPESVGASPARRRRQRSLARPLEHRLALRATSPASPHHLVRLVRRRSRAHARAARRQARRSVARRHATSRIPVSPHRSEDSRGSGSSIFVEKSGRARRVRGCERELGEVQPRLGMVTPAKLVESPEHARRARVELLQRARRPPAVPVVGAPQQLRATERGVRVGDDLTDGVADARGVPGLVGEGLERLRLIQRGRGKSRPRRRRGRGRRRRGRAASSGPDARSDGCAHA